MRKLVVLAAALVLLFVGCGESEEPVRQLFISEVTVLGKTVETPAWFYPASGKMEYFCPDCPHQCMNSEYACREKVHGDECLFYKFNGRSYSLVGDKLYYFLAEDLYVYDTGTGESVRLIDKGNGWEYIFKGEYLYRFDENSAWENGKGYDRIERIHLPDMRAEDISGQGLVWKIVDGVGYYLIADSSPYIVSGLYSQPLYEAGETPPAKELMLHGVELGIALEITDEAVYWVGSDRLREDPDAVVHNLYRYDFAKQSIILVAEDFYSSRIVSDGGYLYAVRQQETGDTLIRTDDYGNITVLGETAENQRLLPGTLEVVGGYVIADVVWDKEDGTMKTGKMVYDTESGRVQTHILQEKTE
ncbi:MAG: hypothetical protein IKV57_08730 [Clostridia bacterium]|nr:hypothetical protein [Clostridia bacterium]